MCGLCFSVVTKPSFQTFVDNLCPGVKLAGRTALSTTHLAREAAMVDLYQQGILEKAEHITITLDGWSNIRMQSVYTVLAILPDRTSMMLQSLDFSQVKHTGQFISGKLVELINKIGAAKVIAINTDHASNMASARKLTSGKAGFTHIINLRCMMHAISLAIGSIMGHAWANGWITQAQRLVSYIRSSHLPLSTLSDVAKQQGIRTGLSTSNATRFTSVHMMIVSILKLAASVPSTFFQHCLDAYNTRFQEINTPLMRLTLFLHPFYRKAISTRYDFNTLCQTAADLWKSCRHPPRLYAPKSRLRHSHRDDQDQIARPEQRGGPDLRAGKVRAVEEGAGLTTQGPFDLGSELPTLPQDHEFIFSEPVAHKIATDGTMDLMDDSELSQTLKAFYEDGLQDKAPTCTDALGCADVLSAADFDLGSNLLVQLPELVAEGAGPAEPDPGDYTGDDFDTHDLVNSMLGAATNL
ncbi:hypothetical protein WJX73_009138 [Symbiochloris irregularis]|uniref:DUF659 domain-containing protein n=1 Tax=Symbiochloris irregularis TaxID=706552 RepID=A0AAW1NGT3_9CHLO